MCTLSVSVSVDIVYIPEADKHLWKSKEGTECLRLSQLQSV